MATKIRLKRVGRRNRPFYRMVVMDSRKRRDGAALEELGWYNPIALDKDFNYNLNEDRIFHWLGLGAQTTEIAHKLLKRAGIAFKWHLMKQGLDEKTIEKEIQKWHLDQDAALKKKSTKKSDKATKQPDEITEEVVAAVEKNDDNKSDTPVQESDESFEIKSEESTEAPKDEPVEEKEPESDTEETQIKADGDSEENSAGSENESEESPAKENTTTTEDDSEEKPENAEISDKKDQE